MLEFPGPMMIHNLVINTLVGLGIDNVIDLGLSTTPTVRNCGVPLENANGGIIFDSFTIIPEWDTQVIKMKRRNL
jgi:hypothetical protein